MTLKDIRRIVTAHDNEGKAIVAEDRPLPHVTRPPTQPGLAFHEVWNTNATPVPLSFTEEDPTNRHRDTAPPQGGTIIRFVDIPPEGKNGPEFDQDQARTLFEAVGLGANASHTIKGRHPLMHRTESVDYGVVIAGEIVLLLDEEECVLKPGDVVVQRGTIHAWANRSDEPCRMLFVLTDARFGTALKAAQESHDIYIKTVS